MTKKTLEKLNTKQRNAVDNYKKLCSRNPRGIRSDAVSTAAMAYLSGLSDAGVLTEIEKKVLFNYITL